MKDPFRVHTIYLLPCQEDGPLFDRGFVQCIQVQPRGAGGRQVARHMLDPNSIIHARSVSPGNSCPDHIFLCPPILLMKNSVWARRGPNRSVPRCVALQSHVYTAVQYFCIGPHCVPIRDRRSCKTAIPMKTASLYSKSRSEQLSRISRVSCITLGILWLSEVGCIPV